MKKNTALLLFLLAATFSWAQKDEKIKGSKIVTIEQKEIGNFNSIEVGDNIEVSLEKGDKTELKIEADDNLHNIITIDLSDNILRLNTSKTAVNFKKLLLRVTYTKDLKMVVSKNESTVNAIQEIQLEDITFKSFNNSKLNLNVNSKNFILQSDDKSKTELNLKAESATIELSKNANLKALIASVDLKCDLYQNAKANLEGDVTNAAIRLDNNANFIGSKLILKNAELIAEGYSNCSINSNAEMSIDASGNTEIQIYGDQQMEIKRFADSATLIKKPKNNPNKKGFISKMKPFFIN
jgi:hypothetical protein